ncbi:oxidoreductase, aldo/keto reductase family protein [Cooperia oncophora]
MTVGGPTITLSNGIQMPQVGLGTWQSRPDEVKAAVKTAIETGYRLIDTAACYENEGAIGEAIKELIEDGKITREELFITTKLWLTHCHPDDAETGIRESLRLLQLDYVDLYLAHFPTCFNHDMSEQNHSVTVEDIWRGLEGLYNKGLTKAIGVSNFNGEQIERILKTATVPIHNLQVELHLYWPQHELHDVCKKHNISVTSYGALGSPGRVNFSLPSGA